MSAPGDLGLVLSDLGPGWVGSVLMVTPKHLQWNGYVHAGVQAPVEKGKG